MLDKISSKDGSERALFDAHLRLQDLYSVVRKPVSAPLALQRELASQVPVLALKLPYLAAPSQRRNRFATGWLSSVRSSWVTMILLFAAALLVGGVWYAVNTNSHRGSAPSITTTTAERSVAVASSVAPADAPQNTAPLNANRVQSNPHGTAGSFATNNSSSSHVGNLVSLRSTGSRNVSANNNINRLLHSKGTSTTEGTQNNSSATTMQANVHETVNSPSATITSSNGNPTTPDNAGNLPPLPLHSVNAVAAQPASIQNQYTPSIIHLDQDNTSGYTPWYIYASGGSRVIMRDPNLSQYVTDNTIGRTGNMIEPSYEAGAEYEFTPRTSAGVRAGLMNFAQYRSITYPGTSPILNSQYYDVEVQANPAVWCALAVTETLNPQDQTRYALSIAGGPAFTAPVAWMGMVEASISYDLTPTLMLRGGVSYDMEQVKESSGSTNAVPSSTTGIIIASPGGALTSNAFGLNLGISLHP